MQKTNAKKSASTKRAVGKPTQSTKAKNELSEKQTATLLKALKTRFEKHPERHKSLQWGNVETRLRARREKLWSLNEMERTGGEPDVIGLDRKSGAYLFADCSPESPGGRRSLCYDRAGLESRKDHPPKGTAIDMAVAMGIELLTEEEYRNLQKLGVFDTTTSSWIWTPDEIRKLGGALFADCRYGRVFTYHNSAPSYYAARGFRGRIEV